MKADTLTARWSRHRDHGYSTLNGERGDIIYDWGDGCKKSDGSVLHTAIGTGRWSLFDQKYDPSLLEELHARGYDLTTLRFSIRKRKSPAVLPLSRIGRWPRNERNERLSARGQVGRFDR